MDPLVRAIREPADPWMTAADFRSFVDAQRRVNELWRDQQAWTRMSILNSAASGHFSTDRTIADYNDDIWHLDAIDLPST
jgi:starch phosphorylase